MKLLKLRQRERGKADFENVDALFDDRKDPPNPIRFVADSGQFEPGKIASAEKDKLPRDPRDADGTGGREDPDADGEDSE